MLHIWAHEIYPALSVYTRKQGKLTYRAVHYPFTWGAFIRRHYTQYIHNKIHGVQFDGSNGKPERTKYQGWNTPFYMLYIFVGCTIPLCTKMCTHGQCRNMTSITYLIMKRINVMYPYHRINKCMSILITKNVFTTLWDKSNWIKLSYG